MFNAYFPKFTLGKGKTDQRRGGGFGMKCAGQTMIVDSFEGGEPTDRLREWTGDNIDVMILTHPHYDHYNGALQMVEDGVKIALMLCYDPGSLRHGVGDSANGRAVKEDIDNAYKVIRKLQSHGTLVRWIDKGSVVPFGDINWRVYRDQPREFTDLDDGNAYAFVNDGSLCLYSPEIGIVLGGDGPRDLEEALEYFDADVSGYAVSHHGNNCPQHSARALAAHGCVVAWQSCIERSGPGTTGWTAYGSRRVKEAKIPVWQQDEDIYIEAAAGKITFRQGNKTITKKVPYQGEYTEGWIKNTKGWWYRYKDGTWPADCTVDLPWSQGVSTFCFDKNGYMVTRWRKIDGAWYFFDTTTGAMKKGWLFADHYWYYLDPSTGIMQTGWLEYNGRLCYLEPEPDKNQGHAYRSQIATIDGKTYEFDDYCYATEATDKPGLNGVDVASYQSGLRPNTLSSTDFVIVKMTQGTDYINPCAEAQYGDSRADGKLLGAYHYAEGGNAVKEAQYFLKKLGNRIGECILALDWEGMQNPTFGSGKDVAWCKAWLDEVYRATGVRSFIYMSKSVTNKYNWATVAQYYPLWGAQYANNEKTGYKDTPWTDSAKWGAWGAPTIFQYSSHGDITGYSGNIDINRANLTRAQWTAYATGGKTQEAKQEYSRDKIVKMARSYLWTKEGSAAHKELVDTYNDWGAEHGYPRGYKAKYTDAWCALFVSAMAIKCGYTDIIPVECGCPQMIELAKKMGSWVENDAYSPTGGDIVLYDWQDSGSGDNQGTADHIGIVETVSGGTEQIIEGNYQDQVARRLLDVNGRYIRGYIVPAYTAQKAQERPVQAQEGTVDDAHRVTGTGTVATSTDPLNIRTGPGTNYAPCTFSPLKKGTKVEICNHRVGKWVLIKYGGRYGYAYSDYIRTE